MKLSDNTVLITGGASGIGLALAIALHKHRNSVIVCGRNEARLYALKREFPEIITYRCDLADESSLQ